MFRFSADRIPVSLILLLSAIDFAVYFMVDNVYLLGGYFFAAILPKSQICAWNHHHQHSRTFKVTALNRILEFFYALHTGVTTNLWVLHHVLGHHHNYLDQSKDESRWTRKSGSKMGELEYSINVAITAYPRGIRVGRRHPKVLRVFFIYSAITFALVAGLVWYRPIPGLLIFVLPMIMGLFLTAWATYEHHSGLNTECEFEASFNNINRWYNLFTGNLGYHTAHHHKQGVHWSELPDLHEQIKQHIPDELIRKTWV